MFKTESRYVSCRIAQSADPSLSKYRMAHTSDISRSYLWIPLIVRALTPLPDPYRASISSCRRKNFLGKACDFPGAVSRYENSWHPIFGPRSVGRSPLSPWASPPGAAALIGLPLAFPYPRARTHIHRSIRTYTPIRFASYTYPYHIFLHIIPLFSAEPHPPKGMPKRQKSLMRSSRENGSERTTREFSPMWYGRISRWRHGGGLP